MAINLTGKLYAWANRTSAIALRKAIAPTGYKFREQVLPNGTIFMYVVPSAESALIIQNAIRRNSRYVLRGGQVAFPTIAEKIKTDAANALDKYEKELAWDKWVTENEQTVKEMFKRWTNKELTHKQLMDMASGASKDLIQQYQRLGGYERWRPTFHQYFGKEPSVAEIEGIKGRFAAPEEYGAYLTASEKTKEVLPSVQRLWRTEYDAPAPGQEEVTKFLMGGEGSGDFQRKYEEAKVRKEYRWKSKEAAPQFQLTKAGVTTPSLANWQKW